MARIRTIKPTFFRSPDIVSLPLTTRLTFIGLWTYVDDAGRGVDDARLVKGDVWQLDDKHTVKKVEADLCVLAERGMIERYSANGRHYLRVVEWHHQKISHPTKSPIPPSPTESFANGGGGGDTSATTRASQGLEELARRITNSAHRDNPNRYQAATYASLKRERGVEALELANRNPTWTGTDIAETLEPSNITPIRTPDPGCVVCTGTGQDPTDPEIPCGCKWRKAS